MKTKLIMFGLMCAFAGAIFLAGYFKGQSSCQKQQSNAIIKEVKDEAESFANRPKSDCDFINRVRKWAAIRAKDEGKPVKRLPLCVSE